jgi:hypothetical protein
VTQQFSVSPESLDFGRVLEGTTARLPLTLTAVSLAGFTVDLQTEAPFSVPTRVDVAGSSDAVVQVTFAAGAQEVTGVISLSQGDQHVDVPVHAVGVHPKTCVPSGPCRESHYDLSSDRCVESVLPNQTACDPGSQCLEAGRCQAGQCLGVARTCNDDDACTDDACLEGQGCIHPTHVCPALTEACQVATCDSQAGCGTGAAADFTLCGAVTCAQALVCQGGQCHAIATPDGTDCAPELACLGKGTCQNHACVRTDAGVWRADWSASLEGTAPAAGSQLQGTSAGLYTVRCGLDAGCGLVSFTTNGFERYVSTFDDGLPREVVQTGAVSVVLRRDGGYEQLDARTGAHGAGLATEVVPVASSADGVLYAVLPRSGGAEVLALADGGVVEDRLYAEPFEAWALDEAGARWGWASAGGSLVRSTPLPDGGLAVTRFALDAGPGSLVTAAGQLVVGFDTLAAPLDDGGLQVTALDLVDGGVLLQPEPWLEAGLVSALVGVCPSPLTSCPAEQQTVTLRVAQVRTGARFFETPLWPVDAGVDTAWQSMLPLANGVWAGLVRASVDGGAGVRSDLVVVNDAGVLLDCPLPEASARVEAALMLSGFLYTLSHDADGGGRLEAWPLKQLPVSGSGWPVVGGLGGQHRAF